MITDWTSETIKEPRQWNIFFIRIAMVLVSCKSNENPTKSDWYCLQVWEYSKPPWFGFPLYSLVFIASLTQPRIHLERGNLNCTATWIRLLCEHVCKRLPCWLMWAQSTQGGTISRNVGLSYIIKQIEHETLSKPVGNILPGSGLWLLVLTSLSDELWP